MDIKKVFLKIYTIKNKIWFVCVYYGCKKAEMQISDFG